MRGLPRRQRLHPFPRPQPVRAERVPASCSPGCVHHRAGALQLRAPVPASVRPHPVRAERVPTSCSPGCVHRRAGALQSAAPRDASVCTRSRAGASVRERSRSRSRARGRERDRRPVCALACKTRQTVHVPCAVVVIRLGWLGRGSRLTSSPSAQRIFGSLQAQSPYARVFS